MMRTSNETFSVKGSEGTWPPMLYWRKIDLPRHPRDAWDDRKLLLWPKKEALAVFNLDVQLAHIEPVVRRALEIYEALERGEIVEAARSDVLRAVNAL